MESLMLHSGQQILCSTSFGVFQGARTDKEGLCDSTFDLPKRDISGHDRKERPELVLNIPRSILPKGNLRNKVYFFYRWKVQISGNSGFCLKLDTYIQIPEWNRTSPAS